MAEHKTPALDWRWCAALVLLALIAHGGVLGAGLVYDDSQLVAENAYLREAGNLGSLFSPWESRLRMGYFESQELSWRPVATAFHLLEFALLGIGSDAAPNAAYDAAGALHAVSWLLHAAVALCCFGFLTALTLPKHAAFAGAALFAVHPALVEPVLMVSFREDLLATGFVVGAAWLVARGPGGWGRAAALALLVFLACGSKESALVAPGLLALVAWYRTTSGPSAPSTPAPEGDAETSASWWKAWIPAAASVAAALGLYALLRFVVITHPGEQELSGLPGGFFGLILGDLWIVSQYLWVTVLPWTLLVDRTVPDPVPWLGVLVGVAAVAALAALAVRSRTTRPGVTAAVCWLGLGLLPVMNLVAVSIPLAERFLYLPAIGVAWLVAVLVAERVPRPDHPAFKKLAAAAAVIAVAAVGRNYARAGDFADEATLWAATYAANPDSSRACANHGLLERNRANALLNQQRLAEAEPIVEEVVRLHERAVELDPRDRNNRMKLAVSYALRAELHKVLGRLEPSAADLAAAVAQVEQVLREEPTRSTAWIRLGDLLQQRGGTGDRAQALAHYRKAMELEPLQLEPRRLYATQLALAGKKREGLAVMDAAPEAQRAHPYWYSTRAWLQAELGDRAGAKQTLDQGIAVFPRDPALRQQWMQVTGGPQPPR